MRDAVAAGADEIDMVIDRGAFLAGRYRQVFDEIVATKAEPAATAHLKVILETGELATLDNVRRASCAGAARRRRLHQDLDRQGQPRRDAAGRARDAAGGARLRRRRPASVRGVKLAGGIRASKEAIRYLVMVNEVAGAAAGSTPTLFRFGASSLLNDLLLQRHKLAHRRLRRPRLRDGGLSMAARRPSSTHPRPSRATSRGCAPSYGIFVDGEFRDGAGETVTTIDPVDERRRWPRSPRPGPPTSTTPSRPRARAYDRSGATLPGRERGKYLFRIARAIQERGRELAVLESLDNGKPIRESRDVDVPLAAAHFFYYAGWADKLEHAGFGPAPRPIGVAGADHPVELPAADGGLEDRAGARDAATPSCSSRPRRRR